MIEFSTSDEAVEDAQKAFWESIAKAFPEITTGDLDPVTALKFDEECKAVVEKWLICNNS